MKNKVIFGVTLVFTLILMLNSGIYAKESPKIPIVFEIENSSSEHIVDRFKFELVPTDENNPMPEGSVDGVYSITAQEAGTYYIDEIDFDTPGVYEYQVYQVAGENSKFVYDKSVYNMIVSVENSEDYTDLDINIILTKEGSTEKQENIKITNEYIEDKDVPSTADINVYSYLAICTFSAIVLICKLKVGKNI